MRAYWEKHVEGARSILSAAGGGVIVTMLVGLLYFVVTPRLDPTMRTAWWVRAVTPLTLGALVAGTVLLAISGARDLWQVRGSNPGSFVARFGEPGQGGAFDDMDRELRGDVGYVALPPTGGWGRVFVTANWLVLARGPYSDAMRWTDIVSLERRGDSATQVDPAALTWIAALERDGRELVFPVAGETLAAQSFGALSAMHQTGAWHGDVARLGEMLRHGESYDGTDPKPVTGYDRVNSFVFPLALAAFAVASFSLVGTSIFGWIFGVGGGLIAGLLAIGLLVEAIRHQDPPTAVLATSTPVAAMAPAMPAGWYADPGGVPQVRWWDGAGWTEHTNAHA